MTTPRESRARALELAVILGKAFPDRAPNLIAELVPMLQNKAAILKAIAERQCNGYSDAYGTYNTAAADVDVNREKAVAAALHVLADAWSGLSFHIGGDPRGPCLSVALEGQPGDGWNKPFYAIY